MNSRINTPLGRVITAFLVASLLTLSVREYRSLGSSAPDFPCSTSSRSEVVIDIEQGESGSSIGQKLFSAGVIKSSTSYFRIALSDSRSERVAPGRHVIEIGLCAKDALSQLLDAERLVDLINIVEGAWITEILPQMYQAGFSKSEIDAALKTVVKPEGFLTLEGLFFPAQYSFGKTVSAQSALQSMVSKTESAMRDAGFLTSKEKFTAFQLLIIASLIQAEGNTGDFGQISQVIRNRLKIGMPLQFDSTVHYIKKSRGSVFLSTQSTYISSPYNTYRKYGLPPGPINNPGIDAMRAAVSPTPGDWLYFITVAPFDTRFTANIEEFNKWKVEYKKNLRAGKFRSLN